MSWLKIEPLKSKAHFPKTRGSGVIQLVYAPSGKRLVLSKYLVETLGLENGVQIGSYKDDKNAFLCLGRVIPGAEETYALKALSGGRKALYSSNAVKEMMEILGLKVGGKSCYTLCGCRLEEMEGNTIALLYREEVMQDE